jgi:sortase A
MSTRTRRQASVLVERLLLLVAVLSLGYYGYVSGEAYLYQAYENRELDAILAAAPARSSDPAPRVRSAPPAGSAIGRIEIPRLGVSAIVRTGVDARTLKLAVGHIPGTSLPGDHGNAGLAAHRDTFFRRLRDIEPDDEIRIVTPSGTSVYRVDRTDIVRPEDVWVLDATPTPALTLVTCYPFSYVGAAPERFVVRASMESARHARASVIP